MTRLSRRRRRRTAWRHYLLITLGCAAVALLMQYLSTVPDAVEQYAEEKVNQAVGKAVKSEIEEATSNR